MRPNLVFFSTFRVSTKTQYVLYQPGITCGHAPHSSAQYIYGAFIYPSWGLFCHANRTFSLKPSRILQVTYPQTIPGRLSMESKLKSCCLYFFRAGRFLEGKYHSTAAVSMALSSGMHKIRSMNSMPMLSYSGLGEVVTKLPSPIDRGRRAYSWILDGICTTKLLGCCSRVSCDSRLRRSRRTD